MNIAINNFIFQREMKYKYSTGKALIINYYQDKNFNLKIL